MLNFRISIAVALLSAVFITSCGKDASDFSAKAATLDDRIKTLEEQVGQLKSQIEINDMVKDWEGIAFMTPGTEGYSLVKTDLGTITVSLENIQPYANGSKVTLTFGNLTAGTIDGFKAKLEWGSLDEDGVPNNKTAKSRKVEFNESLPSGSWTNSNVVLEGIPPAELGFVRLRNVDHRGVRLHR